MTTLQKIFQTDPERRSSGKIILWWEVRRPLYNLFIALIVALNLAIIQLLPNDGYFRLHAGPMLVMGMYAAILLYFIAANICYTGGSLLQIILRTWEGERIKKHVGQLFIYGLIISLIVTLLPVIIALINWSIGYFLTL
ncbi:MAG TPA: hypothetical protein VD884_12490 [Ohtaekwangia sp.]|nr:hypothetical protein [Ohtaekwangia sp.]